MSETSVNGRPSVIPIELPSISEAMRIIDADVGQGVRLAIRWVDDDPRSPHDDGRIPHRSVTQPAFGCIERVARRSRKVEP